MWLKQERIDRGEIDGLSADQAVELAVAKRRSVSWRPSWRSHGKSTRSSSISTFPQRLYPVIESLTGQGIDVSHACRALGVSPSGYYEWKTRPLSPRALRRIWLAGEIADIHKASAGTYGALRVTAELRHGREIIVGHNAVESIMRELGLKGLPTRRLSRGARMARSPRSIWSGGVRTHRPISCG